MSTPKYFKQFPNIKYTIATDLAGNTTDIEIKDYFHLMKVRLDIWAEETLYYTHYVGNGERPDQVSYKEYGDEQYYWIVLQVNDIIDYHNEWPLSAHEFDDFIIKKYNSHRAAGEIAYYETVETKDSLGNLRLPAGIRVGKDYKFTYSEYDDATTYKTSFPRSVSYWEYENDLNEQKKNIYLLKPEYINDYVRDIKNYARSLVSKDSEWNLGEIYRVSVD